MTHFLTGDGIACAGRREALHRQRGDGGAINTAGITAYKAFRQENGLHLKSDRLVNGGVQGWQDGGKSK